MEENKHRIVTLSYVLLLLVLLGLSAWQFYRLLEKRDYIQTVYYNIQHAPAKHLSEADGKYDKVRLEGRLVPEDTFFLYRRFPGASKKSGHYLMMPVKQGDIAVVAVLGWVEEGTSVG